MIGTLLIIPITYSYYVMRVTIEKLKKTRETQNDYFINEKGGEKWNLIYLVKP